MVYVELRNLLKKKIKNATKNHGSKTRLANEVKITRPTINLILETGKAREDVVEKLEAYFFPEKTSKELCKQTVSL